MTKYSKTPGREEALARLREWIKPGDTVYTLLESRAKSGLSRWIRVLLIESSDGKVELTHPNHAVAVVLGLRRDREHEGMFISGCDSDMGFEIVYRLGQALWPDQVIVDGKLTSGGYAIKHRWI